MLEKLIGFLELNDSFIEVNMMHLEVAFYVIKVGMLNIIVADNFSNVGEGFIVLVQFLLESNHQEMFIH